MDELRFNGVVQSGSGNHVRLGVPGRHNLPEAPGDWPIELCPGSLNVRVLRYPDEYLQRGFSTVMDLDHAGFEPAFTIPWDRFGENLLPPTRAMPNRGTAQVWRASLLVSGREKPCWVLRRFGSRLSGILELVSNVKLRDELGLTTDRNDWPATVRMFGQWKPAMTLDTAANQ